MAAPLRVGAKPRVDDEVEQVDDQVDQPTNITEISIR
jgi:hypothetical protein